MLVAAPVGARDPHQFDGADLAGIFHMRPGAEVRERPVDVEGDFLALGEVVDQFDLVRLILEEGARLVAGDDFLNEGRLRGDALLHAVLDGGEIVRRQRARQVEVVVEAVRDRRADGEFGVREDGEHRLGHHMRRRVAHLPERGPDVVVPVRLYESGGLRLHLFTLIVVLFAHGDCPPDNKKARPRNEWGRGDRSHHCRSLRSEEKWWAILGSNQ